MPVNPSEVPIEYKGFLHKHGRIFRVSDNFIIKFLNELYCRAGR